MVTFAIFGGEFVGPGSAQFSYMGPGDIVPGAYAWWGLRAYSGATAGTRVVNLRRDSDQSQQDFNTLTNGSLDIASITTFKGSANLFVTKFYDQTGNGHGVMTGVTAKQPPFTLTGGPSSGTPTITFTAASAHQLGEGANNSNVPQPFTYSAVALYTANATQAPIISETANASQLSWNLSGTNDNTAFIYAGITGANVAATDALFHALNGVLNGAASALMVDGVDNTGLNAGTTNIISSDLTLGTDNGTNFSNGKLQEAGVWSIGFSPAQRTSMNNNQRAFWGF